MRDLADFLTACLPPFSPSSVMAPFYPSFVRKNSLKRKGSISNDRSLSSLNNSTNEKPSASVDTIATASVHKKSSLDTLGPLPNKSPVTLVPPGFGWGKVIKEGKLLSISTFGPKQPVSPTSAQAQAQTPTSPTPHKRLDSTARLASLRKLMHEEPEGGLDY